MKEELKGKIEIVIKKSCVFGKCLNPVEVLGVLKAWEKEDKDVFLGCCGRHVGSVQEIFKKAREVGRKSFLEDFIDVKTGEPWKIVMKKIKLEVAGQTVEIIAENTVGAIQRELIKMGYFPKKPKQGDKVEMRIISLASLDG